MPERLRVALAASAGGHLEQLLKLRSAWEQHELVFVTTMDLAKDQLDRLGRTYVVGECNREHPLRVLAVLARCLRITARERFDVVVSTGAAPGLLMCLAARLRGAKIVWVDSVANVAKLSMSGRLVLPLADLILTQWPEVARMYRKVEYCGAVV